MIETEIFAKGVLGMKKILTTAILFVISATLLIGAFAADASYDLNGDRRVGLIDVLVTLKETVKDTPDAVADINGDGDVTIQDVIYLLKVLLNGEGGDVYMTYSYIDIVSRLTDTKQLSLAHTGETTAEFTSYDRRSQYTGGKYSNWRVNLDGSGYIEDTDDGGQLIADIDGAGYISRIWSATTGPGIIKVFIDGETEATLSLSFEDFFNCTTEPFTYANLCYDDSALGHNCFVPITFSKSCRVVAYDGYMTTANPDGWGKYYNISYTVFPDGTTVEPMPAELSDEQKAALLAADTFIGESIGTNPEGYDDAEFETFTVSKDSPAVKTVSGKGAISGLLVKVDSLGDDVYANSYEAVTTLKNLRIKIWWDGETEPSVNAPLGDFFASSYGFNEVTTLTLGVRDDRTLYNYFYMPYLEGAKIEISTVGDSTETVSLSVNVVENTFKKAEALYFGAQFNLGQYHGDALDANGEYDTTGVRNPDYNFLTVNGAGRFVGVTLNNHKFTNGIDPLSYPGNPWWGEGDEKFFIDGEKFPSWFGTGTEDFFGYAWCSPLWFNKAYHAQSYCEGGINGLGNRVVTRLLIGDSIAFNESFDGYIEKYYSDDYARYGFTSYFYLAKDSTVENINYDSTAVLDYYEPVSSGEYLVEGEYMYVQSYNGKSGVNTEDIVDHQNMMTYSPAWSKGAQLLVRALGESGSVDLALPAPADGEYMLLASFATAADFSIVQVSVNGEEVGEPVDNYATTVAVDYLTEIGKVTLKEGYNNTLTLTNKGRNAAATSTLYRIGLDFVLMIPVSEYTSLEELDLSKYTDVVRLNTKRDVTATDSYLFEGETDLLEDAIADGGTAEKQTFSSSEWSGNAQLWWHLGTTVGDTLSTFIWVEEAGTYHLGIDVTTAKDYGAFSVKLNGSEIGNVDGYSVSVAHKEVDFGAVTLKAGYNKLLFTITGKNASSTAYLVGIDCVSAVKLDESSVITFEGEDEILTNASVTSGTFKAQSMTAWGSAWSGSNQLFWTVAAADNSLTTTITVDTAGDYLLSGGFTVAKDYGMIDIYINGTKVGDTFDGYATSVSHKSVNLGTVTLVEGTNTVEIKVVGKNDSATKYYVGLDYLKIIESN